MSISSKSTNILRPRAFRYWSLPLGSYNRLKIQYYQTRKHLSSSASANLWEQKIRDTRIAPFLILNNSPTATAITDIRGNIFFANSVLLKNSGYTLDELHGKSIFESNLIGQESLQAVTSFYQETTKGAQEGKLEVELVGKSGETHISEVDFRPVFNNFGFLTFRDITAQKKAEQELESYMNAMQALLDASEDSEFIIDRNGKIIAANKIAAKRGQMNLDELIGLNAYSIISSDDWALAAEYNALITNRHAEFNKAIKNKKPGTFVDRFNNKVYLHTLQPIFDDTNNEVKQVAVVVRDITDISRAAQLNRDINDFTLELNKPQSLEEMLELTLDFAISLFRMDSGGIYLVDNTNKNLILRHDKNLSLKFIEDTNNSGSLFLLVWR